MERKKSNQNSIISKLNSFTILKPNQFMVNQSKARLNRPHFITVAILSNKSIITLIYIKHTLSISQQHRSSLSLSLTSYNLQWRKL